MRIVYFDCFSGISGDMILGALVDAGLELDRLSDELAKLNLSGFRIETQRTKRHNLTGTKLNVILGEEEGHRHLRDILEIIDRSEISPTSKKNSQAIFSRLARAEAKIHNIPLEEVHFHEVGALDAIVDVVGSVVGLELMGVEKIYASKLRFGTGFTRCAHGLLPVPVPAVVELCRDVPAERTDIPAELVTPTGAAILTTLSEGFGVAPVFASGQVGYGAGGRDLAQLPNFLRVHIGETEEAFEQDHAVLIETNIDDMTPEIYGYLIERLLSEGAKDAYLTSVMMKKGRPGVLLTALTDEACLKRVVQVLFEETTTLGVRISRVQRMKVSRRAGVSATKFGSVRIKIYEAERRKRAAPEFDDCVRIAKEKNVPILEIYEAALRGTWSDDPGAPCG